LSAVRELVIEAGRTERNYWRDLWSYRELFYILAWRDIAIRYKQTEIGIAWALIQPLLTLLVMTVIFSRIAGLPSEGRAPYALMVIAGMLPWQFFAGALSAASQSLTSNSNLITRVYFPRLIIPAAAVITSLIDFFIAFLILAALMIGYQFWPNWQIISLPIFIALAFIAALGPGLWLAALNVKYRDFRFVVPFIVQFGLYVSPVGFSSTVIRERFGDLLFMLYSLNPMVGVVDGFRWALLGGEANVYWPGLALSSVVTVGFAVFGIRYFRATEKAFADVI